jgi:hypothetical protein
MELVPTASNGRQSHRAKPKNLLSIPMNVSTVAATSINSTQRATPTNRVCLLRSMEGPTRLEQNPAARLQERSRFVK